jgi:serine/threonine protein kinase
MAETTPAKIVCEIPELPEDPRASFDPLKSTLPRAIAGTRPCDETEVDYQALLRQRFRQSAKRKSAENETPPDIAIPMTYTLDKLIGRGGFGEVWEGVQTNFGRRVALKRLRADLQEKSNSIAAAAELYEVTFRQEAITAGCLEHPNILPVYAFGVDAKGVPVLAMKLIRGLPWVERLDEDWDRLPVPDYIGRHLPVLIDMAQAVAFSHSRGILHRDLKPSQVMVGEFGEVLLADWGLAIAFDPAALAREGYTPGEFAAPTTETATNPAGTVAYMAPEQTEPTAARLGPWTDVFLLGATLYYLLTNTPPHDAPVSLAAYADAMRCQITPPEERCPGREMPRDLVELAMQAMRSDPKQRTPSALAFIDGLRDHLTGAGRRREALALTREAAVQLAESNDEYRALSGCVTLLDRAQMMWPDNQATLALMEKVHAAFARAAMQNGDLVLARAHGERLSVGSERAFLLAEIAAHEEDQRRAQNHLRDAYDLVRERSARAEDLMSFMLTDLYDGLKPIGRLDLLDKVVRKAIDYHDSSSDGELSEADYRNRARALSALGEVQRERGDLAGSRATYEKALALLQGVEATEPATIRDLGMAWSKLGDVKRAQGEIDGSLQAYRQTLALFQEAGAASPNDWRSQRDIFIIHERLGFLNELKGNLDDALLEYERSQSIAENLAKDDPDSPARKQDLSFSLNRVADVLKTRGDLAGAADVCTRALSLRREISNAEPDNASFQRDLAVSAMMVGDIRMQMRDYGEALRSYEEAVRLTEQLAHRDMSNASRQSDHALALGNVAEMLRLEGRNQLALDKYLAALEINERLAAHDPSNTFHQFAIGWTRLGLGRVYSALGDSRAARAQWERSVLVLAQTIGTNRGAMSLDAYTQSLILLDRIDEARPHAKELLARGWPDPQFRELCAKAGIS